MESKNFIPKCTGHTNQVVLTNHSIILDVIRPNSKTLLSTNRCWTRTLFLGLPPTLIQRITSTSMHGTPKWQNLERANTPSIDLMDKVQLWCCQPAITRTLILYHPFYFNWKGHCPLTCSGRSKGHSRYQHLNHKPMSQVRIIWRRCQNFHWFNKQPDLRIEWDFHAIVEDIWSLLDVYFFFYPWLG